MQNLELLGPEQGPLLEQSMLTAGLDYYKPTMSQFAHEHEPNAEATFTFRNRGEQRLADYVDQEALQARLDNLMQNGFNAGELYYFASLKTPEGFPMFSTDYMQHIAEARLPKVAVKIDDETQDLAIDVTGEWSMATFWETVVMSELNEMYFEAYLRKHDIDIMQVYDEGARRLDEKIAVLQANPDIKFSDFGTRRHFSIRWQKYVVERLAAECPDNLSGTSNVALAQTLGLKPIGTFAHEMPMAYAGLADARGQNIRQSHGNFLNQWAEDYPSLRTALTDTFTSDFFFEDFTKEQAKAYTALRHDSGDPIAFAEKAIAFYEANNIDPQTKTIVFSDGLDMQTILKLHETFKGRINTMFGWGTTLTNDMGIKPLNIVMKLTHIKDLQTGQEADTVKLSDNPGKHTGPAAKVLQYSDVEFKPLALVA